MKQMKRKSRQNAQALALVKDALGAFSILTMLYVGLFIPAI